MALDTAETTSPAQFGHDVLGFFDTSADAREFLAEVIDSCRQSKETEQLLQQSLLAGAEDWQYLIQCADSKRRKDGRRICSLDGQDILTYVWHIYQGSYLSEVAPRPWEETDRLIALAKALEHEAAHDTSLFGPVQGADGEDYVSIRHLGNSRGGAASHYWSTETETRSASRPQRSRNWNMSTTVNNSLHVVPVQQREAVLGRNGLAVSHWERGSDGQLFSSLNHGLCGQDGQPRDIGVLDDLVRGSTSHTISPYFTPPTSAKKFSSAKRPQPGTISAVPFAPLTAPTFGIIQEEFAHEPFWLLIAVTFLIKTHGKLAIPVFFKVKKRFPTPAEVADPSNAEELTEMIRHLGLSAVRVAFMRKYAQGFLDNVPRAGVRYRVRNYDRRDMDIPANTSIQVAETSFQGVPSVKADDEDMDFWEIGHLTQGKYAIDSWRIFCRDVLLGRASDWNGQGRELEFQPEWMRVMPEDKELRAYLRWMWMREGWEWDPMTGSRTVLRDEMRRAVNERRVEYDDTSGLRIIAEPRTL